MQTPGRTGRENKVKEMSGDGWEGQSEIDRETKREARKKGTSNKMRR